ncbi:MAG: hypothetical protein ACPGLV_06295 [Bacteroidia bacterium]
MIIAILIVAAVLLLSSGVFTVFKIKKSKEKKAKKALFKQMGYDKIGYA